MFLVVVILVGLMGQGARIDPPSLLHSSAGPETTDAILLDDAEPPEEEAKAKAKGRKS